MQRLPVLTKDGSQTLSIPEMGVTYHSLHGAIRESMHVFLHAGFDKALSVHDPASPLFILEMGLGTGLNALLTCREAETQQRLVHYTAIERFPLSTEEVAALDYCEQLGPPGLQPVFEQLHTGAWDVDVDLDLHPFFRFRKCQANILHWEPPHRFDLVYYDAFAPGAQPELWTTELFSRIHHWMNPGGTWVSYCSKGDVRRALQAAGFATEKLPGPPGKREMLRAVAGGW